MIGRFTTQDRFAEKYLDLTPYQYGLNNPLNFIDLNGDSAWYVNEKNGNLYYNKDINTDKTKVKGEEYVKLGENNMFGEEAISACDEMIFNDQQVSENFAKDNGFKKADKEKTVIEKSMTINYTDADGNEWTGNPTIEVEKILDIKSTYVKKEFEQTSDVSKHLRTLDRSFLLGSRTETTAVRHSYTYGKEANNKADYNGPMGFILKILPTIIEHVMSKK